MDLFASEEPVEVEIRGTKFKIKELTGKDIDEMAEEYITVDEDNNPVMDIQAKNKAWLSRAVVGATDKEGNSITSSGKKFEEMTEKERGELLQGLKVNIRQELLTKVFEINEQTANVKKK